MKQNRQSYRHPIWDYRSPGTYCITICTSARRSIFGNVELDTVRLSQLGRIVEREWLATPAHRDYVQGIKHVVMPNHFHAMMLIRSPYPRSGSPFREARVKSKSLGAIVRGFKSAATTAARKELQWRGKVWQPRYHDRIVRTEKEHFRILQYIENNPARWTFDRENPEMKSEHEFYAWLDSLPSELPDISEQPQI